MPQKWATQEQAAVWQLVKAIGTHNKGVLLGALRIDANSLYQKNHEKISAYCLTDDLRF